MTFNIPSLQNSIGTELNDITTDFANLECKNKHYGIKRIKLCKTGYTLYLFSILNCTPIYSSKGLGTDNELHQN